MSSRKVAAAVVATVVLAVTVATAEAATHKRSSRGEVARHTRERVIVTRRSYLDPGTEVLPGSGTYTQYVYPLGFGNHHPEYGNKGDPIYNNFWPLTSSFFPYWW